MSQREPSQAGGHIIHEPQSSENYGLGVKFNVLHILLLQVSLLVLYLIASSHNSITVIPNEHSLTKFTLISAGELPTCTFH